MYTRKRVKYQYTHTLTQIKAIIHCQQPPKFLFKKDPLKMLNGNEKLFKILGIGESYMIDDRPERYIYKRTISRKSSMDRWLQKEYNQYEGQDRKLVFRGSTKTEKKQHFFHI